ncbi:hypothetical protein T492DRAFT_1063249 [Pavlovales sp. CCMP2436]|nr:hypothetical protein T492DRAFT_1063249 [Pavlovales sp. CCMP2436]
MCCVACAAAQASAHAACCCCCFCCCCCGGSGPAPTSAEGALLRCTGLLPLCRPASAPPSPPRSPSLRRLSRNSGEAVSRTAVSSRRSARASAAASSPASSASRARATSLRASSCAAAPASRSNATSVSASERASSDSRRRCLLCSCRARSPLSATAFATVRLPVCPSACSLRVVSAAERAVAARASARASSSATSNVTIRSACCAHCRRTCASAEKSRCGSCRAASALSAFLQRSENVRAMRLAAEVSCVARGSVAMNEARAVAVALPADAVASFSFVSLFVPSLKATCANNLSRHELPGLSCHARASSRCTARTRV